MGYYARHILPRVVHYTCSQRPHMRQRAKVVPEAQGQVLEIGVGSGLNLAYYDPKRVAHVWGLDPSPAMWALAGPQAAEASVPVTFVEGSAEAIPLDDRSVDTVVVTYTLCTIPQVVTALADMRRVLRPGGALLFCEHGLAPDKRVSAWQHRLNPAWRRLGGGCNLTRDIPALLTAGGFRIQRLDTLYLPGWRPASFNYWGKAV